MSRDILAEGNDQICHQIRYDDVRLKVNALGQISVLRGSDSLYMIQGDVFASDCHRVRVDLHAKHFRSAEQRARDGKNAGAAAYV